MDQQFKELEQLQERTHYGCFGISIIAVLIFSSIVIVYKSINQSNSEKYSAPSPAPISTLPEPMKIDEGAQIIQLTPEQWTEHMDALNDHRSALNEHRSLVNELRSEIYTLKQEVQALEKQVKHLEQQLEASRSAKTQH